MPRLTHDDPSMTYACPCCNRGGNVYEREGNGNACDDRPFRCQKCSDTFTVVIERPTRDLEGDALSRGIWQSHREKILEANGLVSHGD